MKKQPPVRLFRHFRKAPRGLRACVAVLLSLGTARAGVPAQGPVGGVVRAGAAEISGEGTGTTIRKSRPGLFQTAAM